MKLLVSLTLALSILAAQLAHSAPATPDSTAFQPAPGSHGGRGRCGLDEFIYQAQQHVDQELLNEEGGESESGSQGRGRRAADPRFTLPSGHTVETPYCARNGQSIPVLGLGLSECYIQRVVQTYSQAAYHPAATLKLRVLSYKSATNSWIDANDIADSVALTNAFFSDTNISWSYDYQIKTDTTRFNSINSGNGVGESGLSSLINSVISDFSIPSTSQNRVYHSYLVVVKFDIENFITGICYPEIELLEARSAAYKDVLSSNIGNICFVDYRYFLSAANSANAAPTSSGSTSAHELGHSLGLLHPHDSVVFQFGDTCYLSSQNIRECLVYASQTSSYEYADFLTDTYNTPIFTAVPDGKTGTSEAQYINNQTCTIGPAFPSGCSGGSFGYTQTNQALNNIMSYAPETCSSAFTADQIARMQCFIDRYVDNQRQTGTRPYGPVTAVPLFFKNNNFITVQWFPPMNLLNGNGGTPSTLPNPAGLSYQIRRSPAHPNGVITVAGNVYQYIDYNVTEPYTSYSYQVVALDNGSPGVSSSYVAASYNSASVAQPSWLLLVGLLAAAVTRLI